MTTKETESSAPKDAVDKARADAKARVGEIPPKPTKDSHADPAAYQAAIDLHEKKKAEHEAIDNARPVAPWENPPKGVPRVEVHTATGVVPGKAA